MTQADNELKGILRSLKAINAALGTTNGADLLADVQEIITAEGVSNAILDTLVTSEGAVNTGLDTAKTFLGADGTSSVAELVVALEAVLEGIP